MSFKPNPPPLPPRLAPVPPPSRLPHLGGTIPPPVRVSLADELARFQGRWRRGLIAGGIYGALFWAGLALLAFGLLDYFAAFSDPSRRTIASVLLVIAGAGVLLGIWEAIRFARREAASEADRALETPRREVLTALELEAQPMPEGGLAHWLRARTIQMAALRLANLEDTRAKPRRQLKTARLRLLTITSILIVLLLITPATWIIMRRLLSPGADIPPYTPLRFNLQPAQAEVLYGGDLLVHAEITGGALPGPVRCLTRDPATGQIEESPAFRETDTKFSRQLEKVSAPLQVAFSVGRARSHWMPVTVRTQPKVQEVILSIDPPSYTRLPRREFAVGSQPLAVLPGSRLTARAASNRPLKGGTLKLQSTEPGAAAQDIASQPDETHRVRFTWEARSTARLTLVVKDVLGTASETVQFEQKVTPDERPQVALRQPAGDVLATPDTELPIEASASDDLGLTRVALVRKLESYRERSQAEAVQEGSRTQEIGGKLNLTPYGLVPGQTIELTAEAGDTNPTLLGVAVSEPARVHIISKEKYAELLRTQSTLAEFEARYTALQEAMDEARKALEELEKAAKSGDPKAAEEARKKALEAHQKAGKIFGEIAKDFPLFDLDEGLSKASEEAMKQLFENAKELQGLWKAPPEELAAAAPKLQKRLGETEKGMGEQMKLGARAAAAGKVMEQAARFNEIVQAQRELVKDFDRLAESVRRGEMEAGKGLEELGQRQAQLAGETRDLEKKMGEALAKLPDEFSEMRSTGEEFLEALKDVDPQSAMDEAVEAAKSGSSRTADARSGEALARLEALLRRDNGICKMCRGENPSFPWPKDLSETLEEMMQALIPKPGKAGGQGQPGQGGPGFGGSSEDGFSMRGKMHRLPLYGPSRLRMAARAGGNSGQGRGGAGQPGGETEAVQNERMAKADPRQQAGESMAPEAVPEAYRDAVKRYFSNPDDQNESAEKKRE